MVQVLLGSKLSVYESGPVQCAKPHTSATSAAKNILRWGVAGIAQKFSIGAEKAEMNKAPSSGEPGPDVARLRKESPSFWAERTSTA